MPARQEPCQTVSARRLCAVLGCSEMTITRLVREGMPKQARGHYDLAAAVSWVLARRDRRVREAAEHPRVRLLAERAEGQRLQNAATRAGLVPAAEVVRARQAFLEAVDAEFDRLVADSPAVLQGLAGRPAAVQQRLFERCREARAAIADRLEHFTAEAVPDD